MSSTDNRSGSIGKGLRIEMAAPMVQVTAPIRSQSPTFRHGCPMIVKPQVKH